MRWMLLVLFICLIPFTLWAGYGKSNVLQKEIRRTPLVAEPIPEQAPPSTPGGGPEKKDCTKNVYYPFTIHILSSQDLNAVKKEMERMKPALRAVFITKANLGVSGTWYRLDYGFFMAAKDAVLKMRELQKNNIIDKGAFIGGPVPYTIELGTFNAKERDLAAQETDRLKRLGVTTYLMEESGGCLRLLTGAFPEMKNANLVLAEVKKLGLNPKIAKR
jgi:hypothetical protein